MKDQTGWENHTQMVLLASCGCRLLVSASHHCGQHQSDDVLKQLEEQWDMPAYEGDGHAPDMH